MNKVILIGRLGRDPECRLMINGTKIVTMQIATTEYYSNLSGNREKHTEWHRVVAFQKNAEICSQYLKKGRLVYLEGRIQSHKWQAPPRVYPGVYRDKYRSHKIS